MLGFCNRQQWSEHIIMAEVWRGWGDEETATDKVKRRRLEWLGHLARMSDDRLRKSALFSWLPQPRPRCGTKKSWRDVVCKDLKGIEVDESVWYEEARRSRAGWRAMYHTGLENCRDTCN